MRFGVALCAVVLVLVVIVIVIMIMIVVVVMMVVVGVVMSSVSVSSAVMVGVVAAMVMIVLRLMSSLLLREKSLQSFTALFGSHTLLHLLVQLRFHILTSLLQVGILLRSINQ